jgi:hypothetical protein
VWVFLQFENNCAGSCGPDSDVVLMNVYLELGNPGGSGFWNEGYLSKGREKGRSVYEQPGNEVDGSYHSKEGSK